MEFHKYTISKKGFFRKSFEIYENDKLKYTVNCPGWLFYSFFIFKDLQEKQVLVIERKYKFFKHKFIFTAKEGIIGELVKGVMSSEYKLDSSIATYVAKANWLGNEYTIYLGENDIAKISRSMWFDKNQYGIAIMEGHHNLFILGMVITIEVMKMSNNNG